MTNYDLYNLPKDARFLEDYMQPFSLSFNAMRHLFEFMNTCGPARYCLVNGWDEGLFPLISLEVVLMGREAVDKV